VRFQTRMIEGTKVVIAGGRDFYDFNYMVECLDEYFSGRDNIVIVSGHARGADKFGEQYADLRGYPIIRMPANWKKYDNKAGFIRNHEMAKIADEVVVFWDSLSGGSKHMIDISEKRNLPVRIFSY